MRLLDEAGRTTRIPDRPLDPYVRVASCSRQRRCRRVPERRLLDTTELFTALADAVFLDVPGRTAKRLLELAGGDDEFKLPVTQEELAGMVGASRERVNKALALFARLGWLEVKGRGRYKFLDRPALEDRATV